MKKFIPILMLVFLAVFSTGCGERAVNLDPVAVANQLAKDVPFKDQMTAVDADTAYSLYGLDAETVAAQQVYVSTGATAEEIGVWQAKDSAAVSKIQEAVKNRIADQKAGFENYVPAEMEKLEHPLLVTKGNYVILCISNNNDKAQHVVDGFLKK